ncbi:histidine kinase [Alkalihalobacillus alcalophilus ATCC 27647 = CGMCC 1.3604]|uniref:Histidine kinase n=1 Tax=Alkalihalobacillus alcalophilus ATCC 27647 = CGMCC 1.3604 TaxID=1218173 RepID=A0A4S4K2U5_ALKAL|nr:bifunctional diguanylate cyclase/phosphodiesterase [Alkalihalobacillus alcalophilus]MED1561295.1 bifunctional diguanylate cyclase/phosphodiesterase [Alkalihalobacillus alcalophilus]THG90349.1 histidine kinase [Alkalihalobacillus alcalophilus ATCC 27647 = CGMCC 1.3604]
MEYFEHIFDNHNIYIVWMSYLFPLDNTLWMSYSIFLEPVQLTVIICAIMVLLLTLSLKFFFVPRAKKQMEYLHGQLLNSFEHGIVITTERGKLVESNTAFRNILKEVGLPAISDLKELGPEFNQIKVKPPFEFNLKSIHEKEKSFEVSKQILENDKKQSYLWLFRDVTVTKKIESEIRYMAFHDNLTKLPNRHFIDKKINEAIRHNRKTACLFLDIERLKFTNDSLGHLAGDQLLIQLSERFKKVVTEGDIVGRIGGDEFVIIVFDERVKEIEQIASECIQQVKVPFVVANQRVRVTLSGGISFFPDDVTSADELIRVADCAMYDAKKAGKNQILVFNSGIEKKVRRRLLMEELLHSALEANEFYLVYQTKIDLNTEKITGTEALLRWKSCEFGNVSPAEFIPIVEEVGLISDLGDWVLKEACLQWVEWNKMKFHPVLMAVNISPIQFTQESFVSEVERIINETGIDPNYLELEITESSSIAYTEATIERFTTLKKMGVKIALDDFGTGYSSFQHLNELPLEMLKIDRSFLQNLLGNKSQEAIVRSMIQLGHNMNLRVLMEGVEEQEQVDWLRGEGCDWVQGFLFSKPEKPDIVTQKLKLSAS